MNGYLSVKNWNTFQQYKDRDPKWIKLHRDILNNYDFDQLTEIQQNHLIKIWLLASKLDNKIPNDTTWIGRQIGAKSKVDVKQLVTHGFIVVYESVQECTETYENVPRDREETETYKEETDTDLPDFINAQTWADFRQHRKEKKQPLKPTTMKRLFKKMEKWHADKIDVNELLDTSIRNGWTGVFPPKDKRKANGTSITHLADHELEEWARRNNAPGPKHQVGYNFDRYRADLEQWQSSK